MRAIIQRVNYAKLSVNNKVVSSIDKGLLILLGIKDTDTEKEATYDNIRVSMLFSQIIPPSPSPTESKRLFFTSVSLLVSHI